MDDSGPGIADYIDIARRRKLLFIVSTPIVLIISVIVAFSLPPIFQSEATILIKGQEIPKEFVRSTVTNFAEQQIEVTRQKIMTSAKIRELIKRYSLYPELKGAASLSELAGQFRANVGVKTIEAKVMNERGTKTKTSIAFKVWFMDKSPVKAQQVANELATLFLDENVRARTSKADDTADFLEEEADRMQERVQILENKIAEFKAQYSNSLPELLQFNLSSIERLEVSLLASQDETVKLKDQIHSLNMEASNLSPFSTSSSSSDGGVTPQQRLIEMKKQYAEQIIHYSDSHPDIVRLKSEIASTEALVRQGQANTETSSDLADNPLYRQIKFRIETSEKELARLMDRREKMESDLAEYKNRVLETHQVQRGYDDLSRDYENTLSKYKELRAKQLQANISQNMEAENKAGSFVLIEPPSVPSYPIKPARNKLLMMGFVLSIGAGIGLMLLAEFLDPGVRGLSAISRVIGHEPLVVVNHMYTAQDLQNRVKNRYKLLWVMCGIGLAGIIAIHFFVMSLDILWFKVMSKVSAM